MIAQDHGRHPQVATQTRRRSNYLRRRHLQKPVPERQDNQKYKMAFEELPAPVTVIGATGKLRYCNKAAEAITSIWFDNQNRLEERWLREITQTRSDIITWDHAGKRVSVRIQNGLQEGHKLLIWKTDLPESIVRNLDYGMSYPEELSATATQLLRKLEAGTTALDGVAEIEPLIESLSAKYNWHYHLPERTNLITRLQQETLHHIVEGLMCYWMILENDREAFLSVLITKDSLDQSVIRLVMSREAIFTEREIPASSYESECPYLRRMGQLMSLCNSQLTLLKHKNNSLVLSIDLPPCLKPVLLTAKPLPERMNADCGELHDLSARFNRYLSEDIPAMISMLENCLNSGDRTLIPQLTHHLKPICVSMEKYELLPVLDNIRDFSSSGFRLKEVPGLIGLLRKSFEDFESKELSVMRKAA